MKTFCRCHQSLDGGLREGKGKWRLFINISGFNGRAVIASGRRVAFCRRWLAHVCEDVTSRVGEF